MVFFYCEIHQCLSCRQFSCSLSDFLLPRSATATVGSAGLAALQTNTPVTNAEADANRRQRAFSHGTQSDPDRAKRTLLLEVTLILGGAAPPEEPARGAAAAGIRSRSSLLVTAAQVGRQKKSLLAAMTESSMASSTFVPACRTPAEAALAILDRSGLQVKFIFFRERSWRFSNFVRPWPN